VPPESEFPLQSLTAARVVVVAGKGGVGKTTVTAVIARAASDAGRRVLVVELDGKPALAALIPDIDVLAISAPDALDEYLRDHGFARIAKRLNRTGVIDVVGTAAPGIDDIVVLGKIKQLERSGDYDLIVVDGPAAGHAITFLMSAAGLADAVGSGPVRAQADDVLELLHDPERCQVVLVTLPETTPVNEVVETAFALEDEVGVQLGPVVVNGVDVGDPLPDDDAVRRAVADLDESDVEGLIEAVAFRRSRRAMEAGEIARLRAELPIPEVTLPALRVAGLTSSDIEQLADALRSGTRSDTRGGPEEVS
jgi:arsenite/tail-anchored protein-transporting ATPase